jgi:outer membrane protein W
MKQPYRIWLVVCGLFSALAVFGQAEDCEETIGRAQQEFNAGRFYGISSILQGCLEGNQLTSEQKVRAYLLLTQAYLVIDDPIAAEDSYLKLLKADPEFIPDEKVDPIEVVYLSKKFTTTPIFTPHFMLGGNVSRKAAFHDISTYPRPVLRDQRFRPGIALGAGMEWNINDNWGLGAEVFYSSKVYFEQTRSISTDDVQDKTERTGWLDLPIYARYTDAFGKVRPYGYLGYSLNLLVRSRIALQFTDITPGSETEAGEQNVSSGADERTTFKRNLLNRSLIFGGGVKYKVGKNFLLADVRYSFGLSNLTNAETNYYTNATDFTFDPSIPRYQFVSDLFRLNNVMVSVGFVYPLYNPRKVKKARTRAVERKISK